jgi:hypothetical protein
LCPSGRPWCLRSTRDVSGDILGRASDRWTTTLLAQLIDIITGVHIMPVGLRGCIHTLGVHMIPSALFLRPQSAVVATLDALRNATRYAKLGYVFRASGSLALHLHGTEWHMLVRKASALMNCSAVSYFRPRGLNRVLRHSSPSTSTRERNRLLHRCRLTRWMSTRHSQTKSTFTSTLNIARHRRLCGRRRRVW